MKYDPTMLGIGVIVGNLIGSLAAQTTNIGNAVFVVVGLLLIIGGWLVHFGRTA